jgi:hypothetical protein
MPLQQLQRLSPTLRWLSRADNSQSQPITIEARDMTLTVTRIRQAMQKHDGADVFALRFEDE